MVGNAFDFATLAEKKVLAVRIAKSGCLVGGAPKAGGSAGLSFCSGTGKTNKYLI